MYKKIFILFIAIFIIISGCYSKEVLKQILDNGIIAEYKDTVDEIIYTIYIVEEKGEKRIDFYSDSFSEYYMGGAPILYDKVVYDEKKKTISFYKADGLLIVTIEFINNYKDIRIIDYGKWLMREDKYRPKNEELDIINRFFGQGFSDSTRIYELW